MRLRRGLLVSLLLAELAACGQRPPPLASTAPERASSCRVRPDGGPVLADRGIGGTGAPVQTADRGIGGTGGPQIADRGIGGTGIVGVITGFASVCLAGQEVALPPNVEVSVDSRPATTDALRAGQVVAVEAQPDPSGLSATRILVRDEVSGPVERATGDRLRVAGQDVTLTSTTWGVRPRTGDWVTVSGLRREDGTIEATRLDPRDPGPVLVRGTLREVDGALMIGALPIRRVPGLADHIGEEVVVTGDLLGGVLIPGGVAPDLLAVDPAAFFGPGVGTVFVEGFAVLETGRLRVGRRLVVPAPGLRLDGPQRGVFRLERSDGGLRAVGMTATPESGLSRLEPAPVPDRSVRAPGRERGRFGRGGRGAQPGRSGRGDRDRDGPSGFDPDARPGDGRFGPPYGGPGSGGSPYGGSGYGGGGVGGPPRGH